MTQAESSLGIQGAVDEEEKMYIMIVSTGGICKQNKVCQLVIIHQQNCASHGTSEAL